MNRPKVFISYAKEDVGHARRMYQELENAGAEPWLDKEDLLPGQKWENEIRTAISESRYFIALISSHSAGRRGYVHKELKQALDVLDEFPESDVFLIPARIDDAEPPHSKLKHLHRVDMFPDWDSGIAKIILTLELHEGSTEKSVVGRSISVSAEWLEDGLQLQSDKLRIPPDETSALFKSWFEWLPKLIKQEIPSSKNTSEALEKAFTLASIRATYDAYGVVPDEEEMQRGASILSRKMDLFYSFAKAAYVKAKEKDIDFEEYIFGNRSSNIEADGEVGPDDHRTLSWTMLRHYVMRAMDLFYSFAKAAYVKAKEKDIDFEEYNFDKRSSKIEADGEVGPDDHRTLLRTMLRHYVMRACDINLDDVEHFEELMRQFPPWEPVVEQVYEVDENSIRKAFGAIKKEMPGTDDEELAEYITSYTIRHCLVEAFPSMEE